MNRSTDPLNSASRDALLLSPRDEAILVAAAAAIDLRLEVAAVVPEQGRFDALALRGEPDDALGVRVAALRDRFAKLPLLVLLPPAAADRAGELFRAGADMVIADGGEAGLAPLLAANLRHLADCHRRDAPPGLAGAALLADRFGSAIGRARRANQRVALLCVAFEGLDGIVVRHGLGAPQQIVDELARRLDGALRETDTLVRLRDEELIVLIEGVADHQAAEQVARYVDHLLDEPVAAGEARLAVGRRIGIALYPDQGRSCDELVAHARRARRLQP